MSVRHLAREPVSGAMMGPRTYVSALDKAS